MKYLIISTLFLCNNEITSYIALMFMSVFAVMDILKARFDDE